ncbi:MAG: DUF1698 domain-containing protein, partial [Chloroflexota bacterium]
GQSEWNADFPDLPDQKNQEDQGNLRPISEHTVGKVLLPEGRYAQMRNVWFIPTVPTLLGWLRKCGFVEEKVLDITPTTAEEQRSTDWMTFKSLPDFLDKADSRKTVEGYPAPVRAVVVGKRP